MSAIVRQIVGRCHVGESYLSVVRYVVSRLSHGRETFFALERETRREMLERIREIHEENRELYRKVMR